MPLFYVRDVLGLLTRQTIGRETPASAIQPPRDQASLTIAMRRPPALDARPRNAAGVDDARKPKSARRSTARMTATMFRAFFRDNRETAAIFAGGAAGTLLRGALSTWLPTRIGEWPWGTFSVNIIGAFMVGFFTTRLLERLPLSSYRRPLLGTGLCGGLTTFSTMQLETIRMLEAHCFRLACEYLVASALGGLLAVQAASATVRRVRIRGRA